MEAVRAPISGFVSLAATPPREMESSPLPESPSPGGPPTAAGAVIVFWAAAIRAAAIGATPDGRERPPTAFPMTRATGAELERWEVLSAVADMWNGPPTAAQLALLDHLAPPAPHRLVMQ